MFKEKDEKFVKETVDLLVKLSNLIDDRGGPYVPLKLGEYISEDRRATVTLTTSDIKEATDRKVVRKDAFRRLANKFEQKGCPAEITKDGLNITNPVIPSKKYTYNELKRTVKEGMDEENMD